MEINSVDAAVNTNPLSQIAVINTDKLKEKPYDVKIKNYNPNEPKTKANMKYTDKQNFRRYKTKTEPKLFSKIMVDDEEELISKIRKEFGIKDTTKKNYSEVETSGTLYYEAPMPQAPQQPERPVRKQTMVKFDELSDITREDIEDILGGIISQIERDEEPPAAGLTLASGEVDDEDLLPFDDDEPAPLMREASRATELSAAITASPGTPADIEELKLELQKRGINLIPGATPKTPRAVKARVGLLRPKIRDFDRNRGASP
jgi:hypothetical protein